MGKSAYQFWLSTNDNKERLRLPVLPGALDISNSSKNETVDISNLGELTIIQDPGAKVLQFSSFFPAHISPLVEYSKPPTPWDAVNKIEKWKKSKQPLRFLVTGTSINIPVSIDGFTYGESGGAVGDLTYSLTLKEFKFVTIRKIKVKTPKKKVPKKTVKKSRPAVKPKARTHKVKSGDTLWALSKRYYKDNGLGWRRIWNANKAAMIKRDGRNRKNPGHWIHIAQVLKIP